MGGILVLLVITWFVYQYYKFWFKAFRLNCSSTGRRPLSIAQMETLQLKNKFKLRKLKAEALDAFLLKPRNVNAFKSLVRLELQSNQKLKGIKRRTISDIKYEVLKKASGSGKLNQEVLDMLNAK